MAYEGFFFNHEIEDWAYEGNFTMRSARSKERRNSLVYEIFKRLQYKIKQKDLNQIRDITTCYLIAKKNITVSLSQNFHH